MARSKNWRNHPMAFFGIVRVLRDDPKTPVVVECESVGAARSLRLDFNSFKAGCIESGFEREFRQFGDELPLWVLPQLETLVRDNPPRMVIQCKDYNEVNAAIEAALAKRKQKLTGDNHE